MKKPLPNKPDNKEIFELLKGTGLENQDKQLIYSILCELWKDPEVQAVYLYGSYARLEQKPYSDIDIAVITGFSKSSRKQKERIGSFSSKNMMYRSFLIYHSQQNSRFLLMEFHYLSGTLIINGTL